MIILCSIIISCDTKTRNPFLKPDHPEAFQRFVKKFKPVDLPYKYKVTQTAGLKLDGLPRLSSWTEDTLFMRSDFMDDVSCYGYLRDTSSFFSMIYIFPSTNYYPVLVSYTKAGRLISHDDLIPNDVSMACGMRGYTLACLIDKDRTVYCADTIVWDYFCDRNGKPVPNSSCTWVDYRKGKMTDEGKILLSKTHHLTNKGKGFEEADR